jgi:hypothetical protein
LRDHAAVPDENQLLDPLALLDLTDLVGHGAGILGVASKDLYPHRAAALVADQADDPLFMLALAVAIVAKGHDLTVLILALEVAAGNEASGYHGQHVFDPGFGPGIKSQVQFELFGQLEHGAAGAVFSGLKDLERVGVTLGQSLSGEGGLNEFELFEVQAADAAMVGVHDFALLAEGGAENADGVKAVGLDFEVK